MRKNRKGYTHPTLNRGRMLREGDQAGAGGNPDATPGGGGDNTETPSGNSGGGGTTPGSQNNTGPDIDVSAFWGGSGQGGQSASSEESAQGGRPDSSSDSGGQSFQEAITSQLNSMTFGDPIFNEEIVRQMNEGNMDGIQGRFEDMGRNIVRQALAMQVGILRPFAEQILEQVRGEFSATLEGRDDSESLVQLFPAAKDPTIRPMIQQVYDQAKKNAKGNREEAVRQTKAMLRHMAGATAEDLNLNISPRGADDSNYMPNPTINWLDELTSRNN